MMEAKDTVIPTLDHSESIWCPHCGEEFGVELNIALHREEQAEISFKAGKREVVEWLRKRNDFNVKNIETGAGLLLTISNWQELLKEAEVE